MRGVRFCDKITKKGKEYFMRKILFFPVILALCVVSFASFGAASRSSRGNTDVSNAPAVSAPATNAAPTVAARAATARNAIKNANNAAVSSARSATRTTAKPASTTARAATKQNNVVAARAGTTKKVIQTGTKVEVAKENTLVDQECQDAYYGCMDAFCMLDNASGGRCQCSDRNAELDVVLEEILKLDEQSYALATEGVERIQMGDNADVIMSRAKAAADKVAKETLESSKQTTKKSRTLDLSAWNTNLFSDDEEDDDIFGDSLTTMETKFADKKGDDLHNAAAKLCTRQLSEKCSPSAGILQLTYAQKVRSDCSAYENSLKQQRNSSQQKLQTAQKALRDAALEMYENENKYDLGQCTIQFKQCLQTTAECGSDFSGCIADTAILQALYGSGKGSKSGTIPTTAVKTGVTTITISSATYDILNGSKKEMCQHVTKQCVNANKNDAVWKTVLKEIVPAVYTAEYSAASNSRMNCISTAVSCVQKVCGSQWDENSDNYDACLSDPDLVAASCKLELARCGGVGDTVSVQDKVWNYVKAKLAAIRVDKCTLEVKECLTSEDRCGEDYSACIGLDTDTIVDLCAEEKLIACQEKFKTDGVRDYIARVAQGLALNIDNTFAQTCQNAANAAMERVCGVSSDDDENSQACPGLVLSSNEIKNAFKWQYCRKGKAECYDDLFSSKITDDRIKRNVIEPRLTGKMDLSLLGFDKSGKAGEGANSTESGKYFYVVDKDPIRKVADGYTDNNNEFLNMIIDSMNRDFGNTVSQAESDPTVDACINGKTFQMISTSEQRGEKGENNGTTYSKNYAEGTGSRDTRRFQNLMDSLHVSVGNQLMNSILSDYNTSLTAYLESGKRDEMYDAIRERRQKILAQELALKIANKEICALTAEEYAALMADADLVSQMKQVQDESNQEECTDKNNEKYYQEPNFCSRATGCSAYGEDESNRSIPNAGLQTEKRRPSYDPETNVCTVKVWTYACERTAGSRNRRDKCVKWYSSDDDEHTKVTYEKYQMKEWNSPNSDVFNCSDNNGGSGGGAS